MKTSFARLEIVAAVLAIAFMIVPLVPYAAR